MRLTDTFALLGTCVVLCAGLVWLLGKSRLPQLPGTWGKRVSVLLVLFFFLILWIPIGSARIPVAAYARGISSDLSITLVALAAWHIGQRALGWRAIPGRDQLAVMVAVALAALFLYPMALGWGNWDAYRPGWGSWGMLMCLGVLCTTCWVSGLKVLPALVALGLLAWAFGLMESGNLWDYLLDPWLSILALVFVSIKCVAIIRRRSNRGPVSCGGPSSGRISSTL